MTYLITLSRDFRKNPTKAENILWQRLRGKRVLGYKFRRQHVIHRYITDFTCISRKLIIELDGEQHLEKIEYDQARTEYLINRGYRELRFWNHEIFNNISGVINIISQHLHRDDERAPCASESIVAPNPIGVTPIRSASGGLD